jgi:hypothetical protein
MRTEPLRFDGVAQRDPAIDAWIKEHADGFGAEVMRKSGDDHRFCQSIGSQDLTS